MTHDSSKITPIPIESADGDEIGDDPIAQRAHEIARIDGRDTPTQADLLAARRELPGGGPPAETPTSSNPGRDAEDSPPA